MCVADSSIPIERLSLWPEMALANVVMSENLRKRRERGDHRQHRPLSLYLHLCLRNDSRIRQTLLPDHPQCERAIDIYKT